MAREIIESARGRETSQISMIKVRGSERECEGVGTIRYSTYQRMRKGITEQTSVRS